MVMECRVSRHPARVKPADRSVVGGMACPSGQWLHTCHKKPKDLVESLPPRRGFDVRRRLRSPDSGDLKNETPTVLSVLFGIQLLLFGLFRFISAFVADTLAPGLVGFVGLVGIVAGVLVRRHPFETVAVLATLLGVVWIVTGAIDVMSGITDNSLTDRGLVALAGIVSIRAGVVVVTWPSPTITAIAWVAGL